MVKQALSGSQINEIIRRSAVLNGDTRPFKPAICEGQRRIDSHAYRQRLAALRIRGATTHDSDKENPQRRQYAQRKYKEFSPPRRTASPDQLANRESRRSERWDRERFETEQNRNRYTEPGIRERFVEPRERDRVRYNREIELAKFRLEQLQTRKDEAVEQGDNDRAADLQYYAISEQEALIKDLESKRKALDHFYSSDNSRSRSCSSSRGRYRQSETRIERERERDRDYYDPIPVWERYEESEVEPEYYYRRTVKERDVERDERYEPPESDGKSLKFDVNLLSLASRPNKISSTCKPELVSIETSRRYTGDSGGETVVLTTGLKDQPSHPGHLRWM